MSAIIENAKHLRARGFSIDDALEHRVETLGVSALIGAYDHAIRNKQWDLLNDDAIHPLDIMYTTKRTPKTIADLYLNGELRGKATGMRNQASAKLQRANKMLVIEKQLRVTHRELASGTSFNRQDRDKQREMLKNAWAAAQ